MLTSSKGKAEQDSFEKAMFNVVVSKVAQMLRLNAGKII